jgi:hypothetical protein
VFTHFCPPRCSIIWTSLSHSRSRSNDIVDVALLEEWRERIALKLYYFLKVCTTRLYYVLSIRVDSGWIKYVRIPNLGRMYSDLRMETLYANMTPKFLGEDAEKRR